MDSLLQETGDFLLQETADTVLLEQQGEGAVDISTLMMMGVG